MMHQLKQRSYTMVVKQFVDLIAVLTMPVLSSPSEVALAITSFSLGKEN